MNEMKQIPNVTVETFVKTLGDIYVHVINRQLPLSLVPTPFVWGPPGVGKSDGVHQLARYIETTNRVNLIAKEIYTERSILRVRKDIDNTSTQRILPRLIDKIDLHEAIIHQQLLQVADTHRIAHLQL